MIAESCEEKVSAQQITELTTSLKRAFTSFESDTELIHNPQAWVHYIQNALTRAEKILASRKKYPKLDNDLFVCLEASLKGAEDRMFAYGRIKKLSEFING
jgi:hypothetical protein